MINTPSEKEALSRQVKDLQQNVPEKKSDRPRVDIKIVVCHLLNKHARDGDTLARASGVVEAHRLAQSE